MVGGQVDPQRHVPQCIADAGDLRHKWQCRAEGQQRGQLQPIGGVDPQEATQPEVAHDRTSELAALQLGGQQIAREYKEQRHAEPADIEYVAKIPLAHDPTAACLGEETDVGAPMKQQYGKRRDAAQAVQVGVKSRLSRALMSHVTGAEAKSTYLFTLCGGRPSAVGPVGKGLLGRMVELSIISDWREPDVIRIAPAPTHKRYAESLEFWTGSTAFVPEWH